MSLKNGWQTLTGQLKPPVEVLFLR
jgi:hypothetical protein